MTTPKTTPGNPTALMTTETETPGLANVNTVMQKVFDATEGAINNLAEGERIFLKDLTSRVGAFLALPLSTVGPFVSFWTKQNTDKCTVAKGRKGGIYKGKHVRKEDLIPRCQHCGQKLRAKNSDSRPNRASHKETTAKAA